MRIQKLTKNNDFARALNHNARNYENTPGVDKDGVIICDGVTDYKTIKENLKMRNQMIKDATGHDVKKNRVRGFEVLFAVNQDFMENAAKRDNYFECARNWCKDTFGEHNYLNSVIHMDEDGAPHMHVMVTCVDKDKDGVNKYCANHWVSNRQSLTELQDSWHSRVEHLGLERGQSAKYTHEYHKSKQEYVKLLQKDLKAVKSLPEHERDLLAVKGLRQAKKTAKIAQNINTNEFVKNFDFDELEQTLSDDMEI